MEAIRTFKGWVPLLGVPALFCIAYLLGMHASLLKLPLCGVKLFIGVDCPGCGLTRSFVALAHGSVYESIKIHPLGIVIAAWLWYQAFRAAYALLRGKGMRPLLSDEARSMVLYAFLVALLAHWVAKLVIQGLGPGLS